MLAAFYQRSIINIASKVCSLLSTEYLSPAHIQLLQTIRFKRLLKHVLKNSQFYRQHYRPHGITLDTIGDISLQDLPPIDKQMMMDHYDDFVCDPFLKRKNLENFLTVSQDPKEKYRNIYTVMHTSGSSGAISLYVYGPNDWAWAKALVVTRVVKPRSHLPRRTRLAFIGTTDGHYAAVSTSSDAPSFLVDFLSLPINTPLERINAKIDAFQPDVLCGYSSGIYLLSQEQLRGKIAVRPERIISTSEPLTSEVNETVKRAFGRAPLNLYAATESPCLAAQCDLHQDLHMEADWHIFEALDDQFRAVPAGIPGRLFLTNLYNYTQPLIRYRMNDEIVKNGHPCQCGSPLPTISNLAGRQEDFLWYNTAEGKRDFVHPSVLHEIFVIGLKRFQYIQLPRNELLMKVIIDGNKETVLPAIRQRMTEILRGKDLDRTVKLHIEVVRDIPNDPVTGKYKTVIPLKDF